jgi:hypothetical protein
MSNQGFLALGYQLISWHDFPMPTLNSTIVDEQFKRLERTCPCPRFFAWSSKESPKEDDWLDFFY